MRTIVVTFITRSGGAREFFPRKLQPDWRSEIECGQTIDEQGIVPVGGLPNNWPRNSTQLLKEVGCFHGARHRLRDRLSGVRVALVCENIAKKNLESACGAPAASAPITESAQRQIGEHLLANRFRREIQ
jgi:hypothetical protein